MKKFWLLLCVATLAAVAGGYAVGAKPPPPPPPPAPPYALQLLSNSFGGTGSSLRQLNDLGDAIGFAETSAGTTVKFVTTPESRDAGVDMVDIQQLLVDGGYCDPTLGQRSGWFIYQIVGIDNGRGIVGMATIALNDQAVDHKPFRMQLAVAVNGTVTIDAMGDLSNPLTNSVAAVNRNGDVLGGISGQLALYSPEFGWSSLGIIKTDAVAVSDRAGDGSVTIVGGNWRLKYSIPLGQIVSNITLQGPYAKDPSVYCYGANAVGQVAGEMTTGRSDSRAFLFDNGVLKNLGNLTSATSWNNSWANAVNGSGVAVGGSLTGSAPGNSGLLYVNSTGKTYDMANCLSGAQKLQYTGLVARELADINQNGVICGPDDGVALNLSFKRAYLLKPASP
jgi:probable HAF family extracellular repeat protein